MFVNLPIQRSKLNKYFYITDKIKACIDGSGKNSPGLSVLEQRVKAHFFYLDCALTDHLRHGFPELGCHTRFTQGPREFSLAHYH